MSKSILKKTTIPVHSPDLKEKFFFFISGVIISVPFTIFFEILTSSLTVFMSQFYALLWSIAIIDPIIEEFGKAYPLFYRHGETGKSIFTLGLLVGLGFGISEFFVYVFLYKASILIRLFGIFFHAATTSIVAYGIATKRTVYFYFISVFLHFLNNFSALFGDIWLITGIGVVVITYWLSSYFYRKLSNMS